MQGLLTRQAGQVAQRLQASGVSGRTVSIKVRLHDFTTLSRSTTLAGPTDSATTIARLAKALLAELDTSGGVRLLGVGVSGLADWIQDDLFGETEADPSGDVEDSPSPAEVVINRANYAPGVDVRHDVWGPGWVWGSGRGVVTVRFETAQSPSGPVRSFPIDDPDLHRSDPLPLPARGDDPQP
jgi:DNA polymerase-4